MNLHIYVFGSLCRGEIDLGSDIDILIITNGYDPRFSPNIYSIYSYDRIIQLWEEGNPFAWHLASEAKIIYSSDKADFIKDLGEPQRYINCLRDCKKFYDLFLFSVDAISDGSSSLIFELSTIFLAIRNFATCFLLGNDNIKDFSRNSALHMNDKSLKVSLVTYKTLERARILSTRGLGNTFEKKIIETVITDLTLIKQWMGKLLNEVENNG